MPRLITCASLLCLALTVPAVLGSIGTESQRPIGALPAKLNLTTDLLTFHRNLVEIQSTSYNESTVGQWLHDSLSSQGYNVEKQWLSKNPPRFNVLAWPGNTRNAKVLLSSHIDTVPPYIPYSIEEYSHNTTIRGRGSVDAKGSVASQVIALNTLLEQAKVSPNDFAVLYVVGEEVSGDGMKLANDLHLTPKAIIFGEPTEGKLVSGHKGILGLKMRTHGRASHSGYPWLGRSANELMVRSLAALMDLADKLPKSDKYGSTTINLGRVDGGVAANVVAESADANIAVRIAKGSADYIREEITKTVHDAVRPFLKDGLKVDDLVTFDFTTGYGPVDLDADVPGFKNMTVNYGTDVPNLRKSVDGQKRYLYGPGTIFVAHSDHEALTVEDLHNAVEDYRRIILHVLSVV